MTARAEALRRRIRGRSGALLFVGLLSGCGGASSGEAPGPRRPDVAGADEESSPGSAAAAPEHEGQLGDAAADDAVLGGPAERLAAGEAELARYEARLAAAGVSVRRTQGRPTPPPVVGGAAEPSAPQGDAPRDRPRKKASKKASNRPSNRPSSGVGAGYGQGSDAGGVSRRSDLDTERAASESAKKDEAIPREEAREGDDDARRAELAEALEAEREASRIDPRPRCEEICSLVEAICTLETQLCSLADAHRWDQRYVDACARATEDCEAAQAACTACSP